jgi:hypothetical protein
VHEFFASGRIIDLILGLMVLEALTLVAYRKVAGRGIGAAQLSVNLGAGACLLLALRAALTGTEWSVVAVALAAAGFMHVLDIRGRWNIAQSPQSTQLNRE